MKSIELSEEGRGLARKIITGLSKIGVALKSNAWKKASEEGLTPTQGQILVLLNSQAGKGMRLQEISKNLGVTSATTSDSVESLVEKKLVVKQRSAKDARSLEISLTAKGKKSAQKTADWPDLFIGAVGALDENEQSVFLRGLIKMIRNLQDTGQVSVARMCVTCEFFKPNVHGGEAKPHHCAFVDAPLAEMDLRLDCEDHKTASAEVNALVWEAFLTGSAVDDY
ncbi:MAG: winged helix-turn-helix transcriptional regulator [Candidatus Nitrohelix vancouverensis]|uniref:Winged helix-turn-helix transcriptional regulator n=1 Tax=Candidatus Nitrohelix vancouverensis TaxID=2705534 RepID=A0A7T0C0T1_9BACT|nr:MAG: winged helix-turn-helix transcriptional regulator [Candidatus Nitrohelix vancouverensis]